MIDYRNDSPITVLAGGVGGARLARGLAAVCRNLTVVVNVGDDDTMHGVRVSPDLDTVMYTLAGIEGPEGWGCADDTFEVMEQIGRLGADNRFRIGDRDLATNLIRTSLLQDGLSLSEITARLADAFRIAARILPVTDQAVPTRIRTGSEWMAFQDYFVLRSAADPVDEVRYEGADQAAPAPGVTAAIAAAERVVIAPSNPPLSVWPMLAIPAVRSAVERAGRVVAVSPLIGGRAVKGPADRVMASLGLAPGNQGVADAYAGLLTDLIVDTGDASEVVTTPARIHSFDTRIALPAAAARLAGQILELA